MDVFQVFFLKIKSSYFLNLNRVLDNQKKNELILVLFLFFWKDSNLCFTLIDIDTVHIDKEINTHKNKTKNYSNVKIMIFVVSVQ